MKGINVLPHIEIFHVANGYLVHQVQPDSGFPPEITKFMHEMFEKLQELNDDIDPIMAKIRRDEMAQEARDFVAKNVPALGSEIKNIWIFSTWTDVIEFLLSLESPKKK